MSGRCLQCVKRSVSLMPALLADELLTDNSWTTYEQSVALEDLWTPPAKMAPLIPELRQHLAPDLLDFLETRRDGTLAVTRSMIDKVLRVRTSSLQHAAPTVPRTYANGSHDRLGSVFSELPEDEGHFGLNYFQHTLDPLRHAPPDYVVEAMSGDVDEDHLASNMPDTIAGVVVVNLSAPRVSLSRARTDPSQRSGD